MGHNSTVSSHSISISFPHIDYWSINPRVLDRHITFRVLTFTFLFCLGDDE